MDPQLEQQINDQLAEMSDLLRQQNSYMASQIKMMESVTTSLKIQTNATNSAAKAEKDAATATTGTTKLAEISANATKLHTEAMTRLSDSFKSGRTALLGFTSAMLDVTPGLAKYSESIKQGLDSVGNFAGGFGPLGMAASGLLKVFSGLVAASLNYVDAVVDAYDSVAKLGGGIGNTAEQIVELGRQAGLSSGTLSILTKNAEALGPNIRALGATTSDGVKNFGKFIAVGDQTLQQYRKLGYSQDDLVAIQTKYIEQQAKAGADLRKSPQALQKESLKYLDSLTALAELTGISVKEQQAALDAALAQENFNAYIFKLEQEKAKATTQEEKDRIQQKIEAKKNFAAFAQATMDGENATAVLESISTDGAVVYTENNAKLLMNGIAIDEMNDNLNKGKDQTGRLAGEQAKAVERFGNQFGAIAEATGKGGRDLMGIMGIDNKMRANAAKFGELKTEEEQERYALELAQKHREIEEKKNETTGIMNDRAVIESQERAARLEFDNLLKITSNKLLKFMTWLMPKLTAGIEFVAKHFDKIVEVSKILAITMGALAAAAVAGKIVSVFRGLGDTLKGMFGGKVGPVGSNPMNPLYVKTTDASDALSDLTGDKPSKGGKPTKDAKGRWRDSKGRFTKAPKGLLGKGGKLLKLGKGLAGGLGGLLGGLALDFASEKAEQAGHMKTAGALSTASYAATGAGLGLMFGPVGAAIGGVAGAAYGLYQNKEKIFGSSSSSSGSGEGNQDALKKMIGQAQIVQAAQLNKSKVEKNAETIAVFADAMSKATGAKDSLASITTAMAEGISSLFSSKPPFKDFEDFAKIEGIDPKRAKDNSQAFVNFSTAMASYKGFGKPTSVISTALAQAAFKFFEVDPPLKDFLYFSFLPINNKQVTTNAKAFVSFANAMATYKGGPGLIDTVSSLIGKGFNALFDQDGPIEAFAKFAEKDFGPKASQNADAFYKYAQAAGILSNGSFTPGSGGGGGGGGGFSGAVQSGLETGGAIGAGAAGVVGGVISGGASLIGKGFEAAKGFITGMTKASENDLRKAGLKIKEGDVQGEGYALDKRIIPFAQNIQANIPGFLRFTAFNDRYHHKLNYNSKHKSGKAVDFTLKRKPSRQEGQALVNMLKNAGAAHAIDEYNNPTGAATAGHMHAQFARNGGLFDGPDKGYPKTMKMLSALDTQSIVMKLARTTASTAASEVKKGLSGRNTSAIHSQNSQLSMEIAKKLDLVIDALENDNSVQTKILKHSR